MSDTLKRFIPDSVRKRYMAKFAVVVVAVLLVTVVTGVYFQGQVSAELTDDTQQQMQTIVELEADAMNDWRVEHQQLARVLSESQEIKSGDSILVDSKLKEEMQQLPDSTHSIHYIDLANRTIAESTNLSDEGRSVDDFDLEWARGSLEFSGDNEVAVSDGFGKDGQHLIAFVSPVEGLSHAIMVTVDAAERAGHFRDSIEGGSTRVIGGEGTVEFTENDSAALTTYRGGADAPVLAKARNGSGAFDRDETGELVAYAPIDGTDWVVVAHAPQSNAYGLRSEVTRDFVVLVGIALVGFLFIGMTLGRNTVVALRDLSEKARAIAQGRIDAEITETSRIDEVGQVQDAFAETQSYLVTVAAKADALARQDFDDSALEEDVPGVFGESLDRMQDDMEEFITDVEQAKDEAERSRQQAERLAESLEGQAVEFSEAMARAADGDLTQRLDDDLENDAMADIAEAFNEMLAELERTVIEIQEFAREVDGVSDDVASGSQEVRSASEQVARSIGEISERAERQNRSLDRVTQEMTDLSATVQEVASTSDEVATRSQEAAERGEQGRTVATKSMEQMAEIESKTAVTVDEIAQLDEEMTRIGEIVELIEEIAEQTNMLALNASIEAARAGEAGEGFGVVADEIKGLAEETHDATQRIEEIIIEVQESTSEANADMREMQVLVEDGRETIEEGLSALEDIVDHVEDANAGVQSIDDATDEQATSAQEVVSMVDEVADLSAAAAEEAESVSAAAEEQTASVTQIADNAQTLTDRAGQLQSMLESFEVSETESDRTVGRA